MLRTMNLLLALGLTFSVAGCASKNAANTDSSEEQQVTTLVVKNDSYLDHNMYLIQGSQRIRLGTARGLSTTKLVIPSQYVFGVSSLQFLADPIGGTVTPVSERINVTKGDEVHLTIRGM